MLHLMAEEEQAELELYFEEFVKGHGSEWQDELQSRDVRGALSIIESEADQEKLETKLAWFFCQLWLNALPVTALTASLQELSKKLDSAQNLHAQAGAVYALAGHKLTLLNHRRLAIPLLTVADKYSSPNISAEVQDNLRVLLEAELSELGLGPVHESYRNQLTEQLSELNKSAPKKQPEAESQITNGKASKQAEVLNPDSILARAEERMRTEEADESAAESNRKNVGLIILVLVVLSTLGYFGTKYFQESELLASARAPAKLGTEDELLLPELSRRMHAAVDESSLDNVKSRLERLEKHKERLQSRADEKSATDAQSIQVDIPEPVKPPPLPKPDTSGLDGVQVKPLENVGGKEIVKPGYYEGRDGRVYGPPPTGALGSAGQRSLDGSPVRAYAVEEFNPPRNYRTLTRTKVLSSPSILAEQIEELEAERPIRVVSQVGMWLELESRKGRRGYIRSQDATPE